MVVALRARVGALPAKFGVNFNKPLILHPKLLYCSSVPKFSLSFNLLWRVNFEQGFSVLSSDIPWERGSIWSILAIYMFNLHIPLGIGGLSIVAYLLQQSLLDPQTEVLSLLVIQILELIGVLVLLRFTGKPENKLSSFFKSYELPKERNWVLASLLGFGSLTLLVFLTSFLADVFIEAKDVSNPILKEILLSSNVSKTACVLVYCFVTPLMEEIVYRGFLLTSLTSTMNWQKAVFLSSMVFSAAHFSGENFLQLFVIGIVLGCCYCWTGNLSSSIAVHSLYNAMTLIITFVS
ncbi:prenyl-dependent CAAX protease, putative [Ricinus communis]|uniref:Prenyl-dependent CAAX protease, putative n=1 Tax=Ricinus communis TaxID=3988 RepID=B9RW17_RICCO|nr:prenyl-dependent CAAX protease, putative [Ricinus communis]